jgi:hypothetical protein
VTRDALRPLEGRLVWFCGRLDTWRPMADGQLTACMVNVSVRPWDGEAPIRDCPVAAVVDHTWIGNIPTSQPRERLLSYEGIGRVSWYRRADGTVDLGLQKVPALDLASAVLKLHAIDDIPSRLQSLRDLLRVTDGGEGVFYAWGMTRTAALASLRHVRDLMAGSEAATARAMAGSIRKGSCRGLDVGLPWGRKRRRSVAA